MGEHDNFNTIAQVTNDVPCRCQLLWIKPTALLVIRSRPHGSSSNFKHFSASAIFESVGNAAYKNAFGNYGETNNFTVNTR